jgi:hypothetical protein
MARELEIGETLLLLRWLLLFLLWTAAQATKLSE